jgi:hypothetical protein
MLRPLNEMNKIYLLSLGWTIEELHNRIANVRNLHKNYKDKTYRIINAGIYLKYKNMLNLIEKD